MNGCPAGKVAYLSRNEARHMARNIGLRGDPYKCPDCPHWHLTTTRPQSKRHRRARRRVEARA